MHECKSEQDCQVCVSMFVAGEPVTQEALDKRCEIWLDRVFGLKLDFAIENSLPVCLEDGVITRDNQVDLLLRFACLCDCIAIATCDNINTNTQDSLPICLEMYSQSLTTVFALLLPLFPTVTSRVSDV